MHGWSSSLGVVIITPTIQTLRLEGTPGLVLVHLFRLIFVCRSLSVFLLSLFFDLFFPSLPLTGVLEVLYPHSAAPMQNRVFDLLFL